MIIVRNQWGGWGTLCAELLAVLLLAGCQTDTSQQPFADIQGLTTARPAETIVLPAVTNGPAASTNGGSAETLRAGDSLTIVFSDLPTGPVSFEARVKEDGGITLLHNLTFIAAGKTLGELEKEIRARYVPDYYGSLTVTIKPQNRFYFVDGEVKAVNRYIYEGRTTVLKAIASASGFTDFANKKRVKLTRANNTTETVNCIKALEDPRLDLEVFPGDKIHVPRRLF